jgi:hypothetical protein
VLLASIPADKAATGQNEEMNRIRSDLIVMILFMAIKGVGRQGRVREKATYAVALSKNTAIFRTHHHSEGVPRMLANGHETAIRYTQFACQAIKDVQMVIHWR